MRVTIYSAQHLQHRAGGIACVRSLSGACNAKGQASPLGASSVVRTGGSTSLRWRPSSLQSNFQRGSLPLLLTAGLPAARQSLSVRAPRGESRNAAKHIVLAPRRSMHQCCALTVRSGHPAGGAQVRCLATKAAGKKDKARPPRCTAYPLALRLASIRQRRSQIEPFCRAS